MAKKLPIGLQSINEIIDDYTYVDKTQIALDMIENSKYYFIARPRRFGKSLFISTLEEILKGNKELFKNCLIASSNYEWTPHPVIHFDFTQISNRTPEQLEESLIRTMETIAASYDVSIETPTLEESIINLVKALSKQNKVAVLVDEYDKPIIDNLNQLDIADANKNLLRALFGTLKGLDNHLKLVFISGVSKFSQISLFSGFNNLKDITLRPEFSALFGYTEEEILNVFKEHIEIAAAERNQSFEDILDEMRSWYNGYLFSYRGTRVYNPFSTLNYLDEKKAQSYWFRTGTPTFLIEQIRKLPESASTLSGAVASDSELLDIRNIENMDLKALMWQTGYLTIHHHDTDTDLYHLDFPNKEVRKAFFESLLQEFAQISPANIIKHAQKCLTDLQSYQFQSFFEKMNTHFAKIPYNLSTHAKEGFYHAVFLSFLEGIGVKTRAEEQTNIGRIDLVFELDKAIYIFEFKVNKDGQTAFDQTQDKNYQEKYSYDGKNLVIIGVNFSTASRNISDWKGQIFSSRNGIQEISSAQSGTQ